MTISEKISTNKKTARSIEDVQIKLSALWVALMLTYQQGDVLRLMSGDFMVGDDLGGLQATQIMWLAMTILMAIPIVMVFLSLSLKYKANRWANIILSIVFFVLNLIGLPTYVSLFDQFLIVLGLVFNVMMIWHAWKWPKQENVEPTA